MIMDDDGNALPHHIEARIRAQHDAGKHHYLDGQCVICHETMPGLNHPDMAAIRAQLGTMGFTCVDADEQSELWSADWSGHDATYIDLRLSVSLP